MKTNQQQILIVDDDPSILGLLRMVISNLGYVVHTALNGDEGLRLAMTHSIDLAILDIHMPKMDGLTLAQNLVDETRVPFVFITRDASAKEVQQASDLGALGYLLKPINPEQIPPFVTVTMARAEEVRRLRKREAHLQSAVEASRIIGAAVGLLMAKHPLNESQAFQRLHDYSRSRRLKIIDVAHTIVNAQANVNLM